MTKQIEHNWFFKHSPDKVWEYLTQSELIEQWLMKNDFLPIVGHDFQFRTPAMPKFNFDGIVYCKVLEIVPLKKLSYSWKGGPGNGRIELDSIVEWTLSPKENGTALQLKHSGFTEADFTMYSIMNDGWFKNVNKIIDQLNAVNNEANND